MARPRSGCEGRCPRSGPARGSCWPRTGGRRGLPPEEVEAFWATRGRRLEEHLRLTAAEVVVAFGAFSATGSVAGAADRHLVTEAQRCLAEGA